MRGVSCRCGVAAVAAFLSAGALEAAGRDEAPLESLRRHGLASAAAVEQLFQRLDGLLRVGGVDGGLRGLDLRHAALARSGGAAFVQAELVQPEPCLQEPAGCDAMVGAFLTSVELQDPETVLTLPAGVYGVRKRTTPWGGAVLEFLTPDGEVVHARAVKDGRNGQASHRLALSYSEGLRVCCEWSASALCWNASVNAAAGDTVRGIGVVFFNPIEGGCWGILVLGGAHVARSGFETPGIPEEFRVDGLQVRFTGRVRKDALTVCQFAPVLELATIEAAGATIRESCTFCEE